MGIHLVYHADVKSKSQASQRLLKPERKSDPKKARPYWSLFLIPLFITLTACSVPTESKPAVIIVSPPSGSEFREGAEVAVQSKSTDAAGVVRVELLIDNVAVRADSVSPAQSEVAMTQSWQATSGTHVIQVRAYNAAGGVSSPVAISVTVTPSATPTLPSPTPTTIPPTVSATATSTACADNAVFVADVTVPDGTPLAPGQTFNKIWRVRNTGCPWGAGYELVFASGEALTATRVSPLPNTPNGKTADLLVAMTAPTAPGAHKGTWQLRNPSGRVFGTIVTVVITVVGPSSQSVPPASAPCSGTPNIESFTATQTILPPLGTTTLKWGPVTNADSVEIDQGIGGVGSPGSLTVTPVGAVTYTMTASCGTNTVTAQIKIMMPFVVTGTLAYSVPGEYSGACPTTINFTANVTASDAGTVTYRWESSDGSNDSGNLTLTFGGAGTQSVTRPWTLGGAGQTITDHWMRIHTLSPTDVTSNNAIFTLRCN